MIDTSTLIAHELRLWLYTFFIFQIISMFFIIYIIKVLWDHGESIGKRRKERLSYQIGASLSYIIFSTIGILLINLNILTTLDNLFLWVAITIFMPLSIGVVLQIIYSRKVNVNTPKNSPKN